MFCKKCGKEQKDGQKFCPKCGEPFLDENGKPYLKGFRKGVQDTKDDVVSKTKEISQRGKKFVDERVRPQLSNTIESLKTTDWHEKKEDVSSQLKDFLNNPSKLGTITKAISILFVVLFFLKTGFSISVLWYFVIGALLFIAFKGISFLKYDRLKSQYITTACCILLMIIAYQMSNKSPQDKFLEIMDDPSTAFVVRIDRKSVSGGGGGAMFRPM